MYSKLLVFVFLQAIKVSDQSMDAATHVSKLGAVKHERGLAIAKKGFHFCFETDNSGDKIIVLMADGALNYPAATAAEASHIRIYIYIYIYIYNILLLPPPPLLLLMLMMMRRMVMVVMVVVVTMV